MSTEEERSESEKIQGWGGTASGVEERIENGRKLAAACAGSPQKDGPVRRLPHKIFGVEKEKGGSRSGRGE